MNSNGLPIDNPDQPGGDEPALSIVMPCLNEERTLATCIAKAQRAASEMGLTAEIIIADNGSTDGSVALAASMGARVIHQPVKGYGAALRAGIEAARAPIILMGDSDDSYDWTSIRPFVEKINQGFDLVIGNRFLGGIMPGAMPKLHRWIGNPVLSSISRTVYQAPIGDFHCGLRAFTRAGYEAMRLKTSGMEFATEMVANAALQGLRIAEVPTCLHPDGRDRPPHLRSFRDGWRHLRFIASYAPDYLYCLPAVAFLIPGLLLTAMLSLGPLKTGGGLYLGIHFLALGCLLTMAGINILSFGLMAKIVLKQQLPRAKSRLADWAMNQFQLEQGLIVGLLIFCVGTFLDIRILTRWLESPGMPMDDTIHMAFVATTAILTGLNLLLTSFLVTTLVNQARNATSSFNTAAPK